MCGLQIGGRRRTQERLGGGYCSIDDPGVYCNHHAFLSLVVAEKVTIAALSG